jgi:hypothetical protein
MDTVTSAQLDGNGMGVEYLELLYFLFLGLMIMYFILLND